MRRNWELELAAGEQQAVALVQPAGFSARVEQVLDTLPWRTPAGPAHRSDAAFITPMPWVLERANGVAVAVEMVEVRCSRRRSPSRAARRPQTYGATGALDASAPITDARPLAGKIVDQAAIVSAHAQASGVVAIGAPGVARQGFSRRPNASVPALIAARAFDGGEVAARVRLGKLCAAALRAIGAVGGVEGVGLAYLVC